MSSILSSESFDQKIIQSNGKRRAIYNMLFAIVWNGFVFSMIYFLGPKLLKMVQDEPVFWVFLLFPVIGIYTFYSSIGDVIDWFKYGEAPLTLNTYPAYVGGNLSGYIDIDIPHVQGQGAEVSLNCSHHYLDKSTKNETTRNVKVLWQDDLLMPTQPQAGKTRVLFSFKIDESLPQTQGKGSERHEWNVAVKLPVAGKDFKRTYVVSVDKKYEMDGVQSLAKEFAKNSSNSSAASVEKSAVIPAAQQLLQGNQGTVKVGQKIPQISTTLDGQRYYYPAARNLTLGIIFLVVSLFTGGMAISMLQAFADFLPTASIIFSIPLVFITVVVFFAGLLLLTHRLEVVVARTGITVKHRMPFYTYVGDLKPSEIADIQISRGGSASGSDGSSKVWYQLKVIDMDGTETSVGDSLEGSSYAKSIQQQMIDGLGHGWQPTEVVKKQGKIEKLKGLRKSSRFKLLAILIQISIMLAVAYDLYNRFKFGGE